MADRELKLEIAATDRSWLVYLRGVPTPDTEMDETRYESMFLPAVDAAIEMLNEFKRRVENW